MAMQSAAGGDDGIGTDGQGRKRESAGAVGRGGEARAIEIEPDTAGAAGVGSEDAAAQGPDGRWGGDQDELAAKIAAGGEAGGREQERESGGGFMRAGDGGGVDGAEIVRGEDDFDLGLLGKREDGLTGGLRGKIERDGGGAEGRPVGKEEDESRKEREQAGGRTRRGRRGSGGRRADHFWERRETT